MKTQLLLLSLLVSVGCFAPVKKVQNPTPHNALVFAPDVIAQPQDQAGLDLLVFASLFSWNISVGTPYTSWSPDHEKLAISSDHFDQYGRRSLSLFDMRSGAVLVKSEVGGEPQWISNSLLGFSCPEEVCGAGRGGAYTINTNGEQKLLLSINATAHARFFPSLDKIFMVIEDQPRYPGTGPMPDIIYSWYQVDPLTQRVSSLSASPLVAGLAPNPLEPGYCVSYDGNREAYSMNGEMTISVYGDPGGQRVFAKAPPMPRFSYDSAGAPPCVSPSLDRVVYFSFDAKANLGEATLMKISAPR